MTGRTRTVLGEEGRVRADAGFTLMEVMITVACVGVLAMVAVPRLQGSLLEARLNAAKPALMEIAARQRMAKLETGSYCCSGNNVTSEDTLATALAASLADSGDFCFMVVTKVANFAAGAVTSGTGATEFEVWGVLRGSTGTDLSPTASNGLACSPVSTSGTKATPTGWVRASTSGLAGRAGKAVLLRYPPPANGALSGLLWQDGISVSNALAP